MQAKGFEVQLLERDPPPPDAFDPTTVPPWRRRGAPQVPHPHFLMGGLRNLVYSHHPNLVHELLRAGVWELPFSETLHPAAKSNYVEEPGDAQLTAFVSRRSTLEIVIRRYVEALPRVEVNFELRGRPARLRTRPQTAHRDRRRCAARSFGNDRTEGRSGDRRIRSLRPPRPSAARRRRGHPRRTFRVGRRLFHPPVPSAARPKYRAAARAAGDHHVRLHDRHASRRQRLLHGSRSQSGKTIRCCTRPSKIRPSSKRSAG